MEQHATQDYITPQPYAQSYPYQPVQPYTEQERATVELRTQLEVECRATARLTEELKVAQEKSATEISLLNFKLQCAGHDVKAAQKQLEENTTEFNSRLDREMADADKYNKRALAAESSLRNYQDEHVKKV